MRVESFPASSGGSLVVITVGASTDVGAAPAIAAGAVTRVTPPCRANSSYSQRNGALRIWADTVPSWKTSTRFVKGISGAAGCPALGAERAKGHLLPNSQPEAADV